MRDILIVDYDPDLREQAGHVLNGGVYTLTFASDGVEALKLVKSKHFDLILVDLLMPGALNGIQILQGMHRHAPASPLVVLSERNGHHEFETALRYGAKEVLLKPVHSDLIKAVADKLTGNIIRQKEAAAADEKPTPEHAQPSVDVEKVMVMQAAPAAPMPKPVECHAKLFAELPESDLQELISRSELVTLQSGEEFNFDARQSMVVLCKGQARCWYKGLMISILDPGETVGESALFSNSSEFLPMILDSDEILQLRVFSKKVLRHFFQNGGHHMVLRFSAQVVKSLSDKLEQLYFELARVHHENSGLSETEPKPKPKPNPSSQ